MVAGVEEASHGERDEAEGDGQPNDHPSLHCSLE